MHTYSTYVYIYVCMYIYIYTVYMQTYICIQHGHPHTVPTRKTSLLARSKLPERIGSAPARGAEQSEEAPRCHQTWRGWTKILQRCGKIMGKCGKIMGKHGKIMGNCGKIMGNCGKKCGKICEETLVNGGE